MICQFHSWVKFDDSKFVTTKYSCFPSSLRFRFDNNDNNVEVLWIIFVNIGFHLWVILVKQWGSYTKENNFKNYFSIKVVYEIREKIIHGRPLI